MYQKTYPTYLVHFNKNHDSKNGQFTYGDGDGDGISDDHAHRKRNTLKEALRDPYKSSSASETKNSGKPHSGTFSPVSYAFYKDEEGRVDNKAYITSGVKKFLLGTLKMGLGGLLLATSDGNKMKKAAGFVSLYSGTVVTTLGAVQTVAGSANAIYRKKHPDKKYD